MVWVGALNSCMRHPIHAFALRNRDEHDVRDELDRFRWRLLPALYQPKAEKQMRLTATLRKARWISALLS